MTEPAHVCLSAVSIFDRVCSSSILGHDPGRPALTPHLVACCLKNTGLKISPRALALSRFLEQFWHTRAKCFSRQWRVSQYCGGRLGVLATRRSSWAHSSGFTTSVETTDENEQDLKKKIDPAFSRCRFEEQHEKKPKRCFFKH